MECYLKIDQARSTPPGTTDASVVLAAHDDPVVVHGSAITASFSPRHHACFVR
jgi:hypothetical protein